MELYKSESKEEKFSPFMKMLDEMSIKNLPNPVLTRPTFRVSRRNTVSVGRNNF